MAGELWMSDVMHGPAVVVSGRQRKTYLIAISTSRTRAWRPEVRAATRALLPPAPHLHSGAYHAALRAVPHQANRRKPLAFAFLFAVLVSSAPDTIRTYDLGFRNPAKTWGVAILHSSRTFRLFGVWLRLASALARVHFHTLSIDA